ncbi:MAG TPA: amino acid ABC transporter permease [Mycobacteriales bacterium]|nr:amino acid ABC transporter permease [Mycobacteriales bacterium]
MATRRPRKDRASVLFDAPGPRGRRLNHILSAVTAVVLLSVLGWLVWQLNNKGQWDWKLWEPFTQAQVWQNSILRGLTNTLTAAAVAAALAVAFGVIFGFGRLSDHRWIRVPSGIIVEFFRAIPVLIMIFFAQAGPPVIADAFNMSIEPISAFEAVVIGLALYNGAVLAEIFRAGIRAVPAGQAEAGYALGLRKSGVLLRILLPQAVTAMMPVIVSQIVVLLKDSALGYIVAYEDLLNAGFVQIKSNFDNLIPAVIVIAAIYVGINMSISRLANWLEGRSRRNRKSFAAPLPASTLSMPAGTFNP